MSYNDQYICPNCGSISIKVTEVLVTGEGDAPCPQCGAVMLSDYVPHTLEKGV